MKIRDKSGKWLNSKVFSETAAFFKKHGVYTFHIKKTLEYKNFWQEEKRRCVEGYEVGGVKITGKHYFYLNYCPIKRIVEGDVTVGKKKTKFFDFPDFWDTDYDYFWQLEIAENGISEKELIKLGLKERPKYLEGGKFISVGKARRKGFSYKDAAVALWYYTFIRQSLVLLCAFDKKYLYPKGIFTMCNYYSNFINEHTYFAKRRLVDRAADGYFKAGWVEEIDGKKIERGSFSEIMSITFADNPDAARGKDANLVIIEEAGEWPDFKHAYSAIEPTVRDGDITTGFLIQFGTGSSSGSSLDFEEVFYNPDGFNMQSFKNDWDDEAGAEENCGWYFPAYKNYVGFIDEQGNSDIEGSKAALLKKREQIRKTAKSPEDIKRHEIEWSWKPSESFQIISNNFFPVDDLKKQLGLCKTDKKLQGICGNISKNQFGQIEFTPDLDAKPLEYRDKRYDKSGTIQIWEKPKAGDIPFNLYVSGLDPYAEDLADYSESLGSFQIFKRYMAGEEIIDEIVCEYTGRPKNFKEYYDTILILLEWYGIIGNCLYENNINNFKTHCENRHRLYHLAKTPSILKSASNQNVNTYGLRIVGNAFSSVKSEIVTYVNNWLREENSDGVINVYKIKSIGLLQELISYNDTGNFDRFIAFALCLVRHIELIKKPVKSQDAYNKNKPFFENPLFI